MKTTIAAWLITFFLIAETSAAQLPAAGTTGGVGVNLWHNGEDWSLVQSTGAKFVRMNLYSSQCETGSIGNYNFTASGDDAMVAACQQRGIRVMYDLFWGNPLYGPTDMGSAAWRQNYANFAAAAARNFKGKGIVYELWNEPNGYGQGAEVAENYMAFVNEVSTAMRAADPSCTIIGPAVNDNGGTTFLTDCIDRGLLDKVDAISLHPYANPPWSVPENVVSRYAAVRDLMQTRGGKTLPIVSSEWGYSTPAVSGNEELQGDYLARSTLVNLSQGIPLSIWFEFRDRSKTGDEWENNYGMVAHDDATGAQTGLRPAYYQMQELTQSLRGTTFSRRRTDGWWMESNDWLLEFALPTGETTLAAWTAGDSHYIYNGDWGLLYLTSTPFYVNPVPAPEPGSFLLLEIGLVGILAYTKKRGTANGRQ